MILKSTTFNLADAVIKWAVRRGLTADRSKINPCAVRRHLRPKNEINEATKPLFYSNLFPDVADAKFASIFKFQSLKSLNYFPQFLESEITVPKLYLLYVV